MFPSGASWRLRRSSHLRLWEQLPHQRRNNPTPPDPPGLQFIFLSNLCQKSELENSTTCCLFQFFPPNLCPKLILESCDMLILAGWSQTSVNRFSWKQRHHQSDTNTPVFFFLLWSFDLQNEGYKYQFVQRAAGRPQVNLEPPPQYVLFSFLQRALVRITSSAKF